MAQPLERIISSVSCESNSGNYSPSVTLSFFGYVTREQAVAKIQEYLIAYYSSGCYNVNFFRIQNNSPSKITIGRLRPKFRQSIALYSIVGEYPAKKNKRRRENISLGRVIVRGMRQSGLIHKILFEIFDKKQQGDSMVNKPYSESEARQFCSYIKTIELI